MIFKFLYSVSAVPFVLLNLRAPEGGQGGAGDTVELPEKAPAIAGNSPEEKITSAGGIITDLFGKATKLSSLLTGARGALKTEQDAHTTTKGLLKTEQDAHTTTKSELQTEKDAHTTVKGKLTTAEGNVTRLEKLCGLNGVDPKAAVPAEPEEAAASDNTPKGAWDKYNDLKAKEAKGEVEHGTAQNYYREKKTLLNKLRGGK